MADVRHSPTAICFTTGRARKKSTGGRRVGIIGEASHGHSQARSPRRRSQREAGQGGMGQQGLAAPGARQRGRRSVGGLGAAGGWGARAAERCQTPVAGQRSGRAASISSTDFKPAMDLSPRKRTPALVTGAAPCPGCAGKIARALLRGEEGATAGGRCSCARKTCRLRHTLDGRGSTAMADSVTRLTVVAAPPWQTGQWLGGGGVWACKQRQRPDRRDRTGRLGVERVVEATHRTARDSKRARQYSST